MNNTEALVAQIVFKMIPISEDRKDIAQDIYLKSFNNLKSFKFQSKLSTWIAQIAYNTCFSYLEKKKLVLLDNAGTDYDSTDNILESLVSENDNDVNNPQKLLSKKELSGILQSEIDKLSPVYKTLITLYHNEEMNYAELAEITGLPEGTVKNYLFRARKKLRNNLLLNYKRDTL
ncbi:MAG: sigma-70 family RNA polymerase sigma factor [Chitinophagaceae bacterium]|nr:sigma-70 family RNA polymerase sigma factor [Chitinophagaceae bacterium]